MPMSQIPMKPSIFILSLIASTVVASLPLHAATIIDLDLTSDNSGGMTLASGNNEFSFDGFDVQYLIVAGGGAGGGPTGLRGAGGGGAGGLLAGTTSIGGVQSIIVGAGGAGVTNSVGSNGGNSSAFTLTALGGGYGGSNGNGTPGGGPANVGGSGGGAHGSANNSQAAGTTGQGHSGANRTGNSGGGGGGAGAAAIGLNGGVGSALTITGSSVTYATGGAGGLQNGVATPGADGAANTGNGGGGASDANTAKGGNGGSGIVVVRYSGPQVLSGGTVSSDAGDTVHQFLSTGTSALDLHSATINGDIDGVGDLVWNKTGTLTLGGTNNYTGTTTVESGTLLVNGNNSGTGAVSVASGAALGGTGTIGGAVNFASTSLFDVVDLFDSLTVGGTVSFDTGFGIDNLVGIDWDSVALNTPFTLISTSQTSFPNLGNFEFDNRTPVGSMGREAYFQPGSLQLVVVPEPTTLALLGAGVALLSRRLARRRRS